MGRFLFVVPPLAGHVNPTISVGSELTRRGHEVAWAGVPGVTELLLPDGARFFPTGPKWIGDDAIRKRKDYQGLRHAAALKFLWEEVLIPLGLAMADDVNALVDLWHPSVVIADQQALAGAAIARKQRLPWATSATMTSEVVSSVSALPVVAEWVAEQLRWFQSALGVPQALACLSDLRFSEHLVLVFSSRRLVGEHHAFPPHYAFVGPSMTGRRGTESFPWEWLDPRLPRVVVSLGTVSDANERFFTVASEALAGEALQAIFVAPPSLLGDRPPAANLLVQERVPMLDLLPHLDAVVCHGGDNTVLETLAHGLPLVVAPIRDSQPIVAEQVVQAGAGIRVRFGRVRPSDLRVAVRTVLDEPSFRQGAAAIGESFRDAGGAAAAASRLEALAGAGEGLVEDAQPARETR